MSYPPDEHGLRDLEIVSWLERDDHAIGELPVLDPLRDATGAVSAGALVTLVDLVCARIVLHAVDPHWIATADLSFVSGARPTDGVVVAEARIVRAGSKLVVADVDLGSAGRAVATFVRIPREASRVADRPPTRIGERMGMERTGPRLGVPIVERMGIRRIDGGAELPRDEYVANSFGAINGGVLGFLVAEATGRPADDITLRYIGQAKVGPARAMATPIRDGVFDVRVVDAGAEDLLLSRALVTTARGDG